MPRFIVIELLDHATDAEAIDFAEDINRAFRPHFDAYVAEIETKPRTLLRAELERTAAELGFDLDA